MFELGNKGVMWLTKGFTKTLKCCFWMRRTRSKDAPDFISDRARTHNQSFRMDASGSRTTASEQLAVIRDIIHFRNNTCVCVCSQQVEHRIQIQTVWPGVTPLMSALGRQRQKEFCEFKPSPAYVASSKPELYGIPCLKKQNTIK